MISNCKFLLPLALTMVLSFAPVSSAIEISSATPIAEVVAEPLPGKTCTESIEALVKACMEKDPPQTTVIPCGDKTIYFDGKNWRIYRCSTGKFPPDPSCVPLNDEPTDGPGSIICNSCPSAVKNRPGCTKRKLPVTVAEVAPAY